MKTKWTQGLNADETKEMVSYFKSSLLLRKRLDKIIRDKIESSTASSLSKDTYDSPSWAYLQADRNGYERALREIISLISEESVTKS